MVVVTPAAALVPLDVSAATDTGIDPLESLPTRTDSHVRRPGCPHQPDSHVPISFDTTEHVPISSVAAAHVPISSLRNFGTNWSVRSQRRHPPTPYPVGTPHYRLHNPTRHR